MEEKVKLRKATPADLKALEALEKSCFPDPYPMKDLEKMVNADNYKTVVAEKDGKVVGYLIAQVSADYDLLRVGADPQLRRLGIGSQLLKELYDRRTFTELLEGNIPGEQLYLKHGFLHLSIRKDYYGPGKNALVMMRAAGAEAA